MLIPRGSWEVKLPDLHLFGRRRQGFGNTKIVGHFVTLLMGGVLLDRAQVGKRVVLPFASRRFCDVFDAIVRLENLLQTQTALLLILKRALKFDGPLQRIVAVLSIVVGKLIPVGCVAAFVVLLLAILRGNAELAVSRFVTS